MGKYVEVDVDDLQSLLFCTTLAKSVELLLKAAESDELFQMEKGRLTAAYDRLANALRGAQRRETMPHLFQPATAKQLEELERLFVAWEIDRHPTDEDDGVINREGFQITGESLFGASTQPMNRYRHLVSAGLCEFGNVKTFTMWQSSGDRVVKDVPHIFLRLTTRGFQELRGHLDAKERAEALAAEAEERQIQIEAGDHDSAIARAGEAPAPIRDGDSREPEAAPQGGTPAAI